MIFFILLEWSILKREYNIWCKFEFQSHAIFIWRNCQKLHISSFFRLNKSGPMEIYLLLVGINKKALNKFLFM